MRSEALQIQMAFRQGGPGLQALLQIQQLMGRQQPQMTRGQRQAVVAGQSPQQRHGDAGQGLSQQGLMALAADTIEHHTGDAQPGLVVAEAPHQGRHRAGLTAGVHHQNHR